MPGKLQVHSPAALQSPPPQGDAPSVCPFNLQPSKAPTAPHRCLCPAHQGAPVAHTSAPHGGGLGPGGAGPEDLRPQTSAPGPAAEPTAAPRTQQVKTGEALGAQLHPHSATPVTLDRQGAHKTGASRGYQPQPEAWAQGAAGARATPQGEAMQARETKAWAAQLPTGNQKKSL